MRSLLVLLPIAALAGWVGVRHLPARDADAEPARVNRAQEIQSVAIDGRGLPMVSLRALLSTQAGQQIDTAKLAHDREALEQALVDRGYFAAHVRDAQVSYDATGAAFVTFRIEQGPQFRVRAVTVTGATVKDAGVIALAAGDVASADRIQLARSALADRLEAHGKPIAVAANIHKDVASSVVDIELVASK